MIIRNNMEKKMCKRCEHEWLPRLSNPLQCPRCKSYHWETEPQLRLQESHGKVKIVEVIKNGNL